MKYRNREKFIKELKKELKRHNEIEFALLYGSMAKGKITPLSDIDTGIFIRNEKLQNENRLIPFIEKIEKVVSEIAECDLADVTILNHADPLLKFKIFTTGIIIFCRDTKKYYFEKAMSYSLYQDYKYFLEFYYKKALEKLGIK